MNRIRLNYRHLWFLPLLTLVLASGCWFLLSGTWVVVFAVADEEIDNTHPGLNVFHVDLTEEDAWEDHKDNLDNIEDVAMTFRFVNTSLENEATGRIYVSSDNSLTDTTEIKATATLILDGLTVPINDSLEVDLAFYYDVFQNFEALRDLVKTGAFTGYAIVPDETQVHVRHFVVVVTFSASV
jgi:hypothetical protein